ncbi:hypothetical protein CgunFtcFv8_012288 [Champsocephalus gunnari]|nr:hypothetical protein CgunFtcFv8_012288 [Champsocephalus gunnari]
MRLSDRFPAAAAPPSSSTSSAPYGIRPGDRFSSTNCVPHDHQQQPVAYHPPKTRVRWDRKVRFCSYRS